SEAHIAGVRFILNRINSKSEEDILRKSLLDKEIQPSLVIHYSPSISSAWLKGIPIQVEKTHPEIQGFIDQLEGDMESYYRESV
ncbi:MAG: hypothetical protein Q7J07_10130, partial [Pelolinea sp.]|nr:hypothetical protein [Pelolinea sp.]